MPDFPLQGVTFYNFVASMATPGSEQQVVALTPSNLSKLNKRLTSALAVSGTAFCLLALTVALEIIRVRSLNGVVLIGILGGALVGAWSVQVHRKWKRVHFLLGDCTLLTAAEQQELEHIEAICPLAAQAGVKRDKKKANKQDLWRAQKALNQWLQGR